MNVIFIYKFILIKIDFDDKAAETKRRKIFSLSRYRECVDCELIHFVLGLPSRYAIVIMRGEAGMVNSEIGFRVETCEAPDTFPLGSALVYATQQRNGKNLS